MRKFFTRKKVFAFVLLSGCFALFTTVLALEAWPPSPMPPDHIGVTKDTNIGQFIRYLYEWGIALGGIATFISFVIAGFQYITSVGNPQSMNDAIDRIKSALFGLVMLLSAVVLLNTINPELTKFHLDPFTPVAGNAFDDCDVGTPTKPSTHMCKSGFECKVYSPTDTKGVCIPTSTANILCSKAQIFSDIDFGGTAQDIQIDETIETAPKSVRAWYKGKDPITGAAVEKECDKMEVLDPKDPTGKTKMVSPDYSGCGCILRLFNAHTSWIWSSCGDVITETPAYEKDLTRWADRDVYCVRLLAPQAPKTP